MGVLILTPDDLVRVARVLIAVASGLVAATLSALLARKTGQTLYGAFTRMVLSFLAYGVADYLTREAWGRLGWDAGITRLAAAADIVSVAWMMQTLVGFASDVLGRPVGKVAQRLLNIPFAGAIVAGASLFVPGVPWTEGAMAGVGLAFLGLLLTTTTACGIWLLRRRGTVSDRALRRWAVTMGALILTFLPLWLLEAFRVVQWGAFAWYFLLMNLAGFLTMTVLHFRPARPGEETLFDGNDLHRCAERFGWTEREREIADLHARGLSSRQIAEKLFIAPKTVRNHVANLYAKSGIHQRIALLELLATP